MNLSTIESFSLKSSETSTFSAFFWGGQTDFLPEPAPLSRRNMDFQFNLLRMVNAKQSGLDILVARVSYRGEVDAF